MKVLKVNIVQVNTAKAEAEMAYGLQASKVQARIKEEEMQVTSSISHIYIFNICNIYVILTTTDQVQVVERQQEINIQQQEIMKKEKELDSKVNKIMSSNDRAVMKDKQLH